MKLIFETRVILSMTLFLILIIRGNTQTIALQTAPTRLPSWQQWSAVSQEVKPDQAAIEKTTFVVRDIFRLKYGHYREAIGLFDEAVKSNLMPSTNFRVLTDFTGDAYRLIIEMGHNSLAEYEKTLSSDANATAFRDWYEKFKPHVETSTREILRWVR